jgi:hypothetical protein
MSWNSRTLRGVLVSKAFYKSGGNDVLDLSFETEQGSMGVSAYGKLAVRLDNFTIVHNTYEVEYEDNPGARGGHRVSSIRRA